MLIFSFVLFPAVFSAFWATKNANPVVAVFALTFSAIVSFIRGFFFFPEIPTSLNIFLIAFRFLIPMFLFPLGFYLFFLLISRDDSKTKIKVFFEFLLAFYAVALPFESIRNFPTFDLYVCFLRPAIYLSFVFAASAELKKMQLLAAEKDKKNVLKMLLLLIAECAVCCFLDASYFSRLNAIAAIVFSAVFIGLEIFATIKISMSSRPSSQTPQSPSSTEQVPD